MDSMLWRSLFRCLFTIEPSTPIQNQSKKGREEGPSASAPIEQNKASNFSQDLRLQEDCFTTNPIGQAEASGFFQGLRLREERSAMDLGKIVSRLDQDLRAANDAWEILAW